MVAKSKLQEQILEISRDYLGPAAERFIERQVNTHLKKDFNSITKSDVVKLVDWIRLSFALLTNDGQLVDEYAERLLEAAKGNSSKSYSR
jgi:uncharacterized protein YlxP (DUF503 family)